MYTKCTSKCNDQGHIQTKGHIQRKCTQRAHPNQKCENFQTLQSSESFYLLIKVKITGLHFILTVHKRHMQTDTDRQRHRHRVINTGTYNPFTRSKSRVCLQLHTDRHAYRQDNTQSIQHSTVCLQSLIMYVFSLCHSLQCAHNEFHFPAHVCISM